MSQLQTVRLSLRWLFLLALLMFGLGIVGGIVGSQLVGPRGALTSENPDQIISTIQQVTVSPNKNRAQILDNVRRSIVLIRQTVGNTTSYVGTGIVVTNDGVIATTATVKGDQVVAVDEQGKTTVLSSLGIDPLYGITYLKLPSGVAVPVELSTVSDVTGNDLLAISRDQQTLAITTYPFHSQAYELPGQDDSFLGRQRILVGTSPASDILPSASLLDDEGKLTGILIDSERGLSLSAQDIKGSLDRIASNKREVNPFTALGFDVRYDFIDIPASEAKAAALHQFVAVVTSVTPRSSAAQAGIKSGDAITMVGTTPLTWQTSLSEALGQNLPLAVTTVRQGVERVATLQSVQLP